MHTEVFAAHFLRYAILKFKAEAKPQKHSFVVHGKMSDGL